MTQAELEADWTLKATHQIWSPHTFLCSNCSPSNKDPQSVQGVQGSTLRHKPWDWQQGSHRCTQKGLFIATHSWGFSTCFLTMILTTTLPEPQPRLLLTLPVRKSLNLEQPSVLPKVTKLVKEPGLLPRPVVCGLVLNFYCFTISHDLKSPPTQLFNFIPSHHMAPLPLGYSLFFFSPISSHKLPTSFSTIFHPLPNEVPIFTNVRLLCLPHTLPEHLPNQYLNHFIQVYPIPVSAFPPDDQAGPLSQP